MTIFLSPVAQINHRLIDRWQEMLDRDLNFPVDIKDGSDEYEITALLPGVKADDLDIQVVNETVSIQGELKVERDEKAEYLLVERPSGRFSRVLNFPVALDPAKADAHFENGVLTLKLPKAESAKPRTIKVVTN